MKKVAVLLIAILLIVIVLLITYIYYDKAPKAKPNVTKVEYTNKTTQDRKIGKPTKKDRKFKNPLNKAAFFSSAQKFQNKMIPIDTYIVGTWKTNTYVEYSDSVRFISGKTGYEEMQIAPFAISFDQETAFYTTPSPKLIQISDLRGNIVLTDSIASLFYPLDKDHMVFNLRRGSFLLNRVSSEYALLDSMVKSWDRLKNANLGLLKITNLVNAINENEEIYIPTDWILFDITNLKNSQIKIVSAENHSNIYAYEYTVEAVQFSLTMPNIAEIKWKISQELSIEDWAYKSYSDCNISSVLYLDYKSDEGNYFVEHEVQLSGEKETKSIRIKGELVNNKEIQNELAVHAFFQMKGWEDTELIKASKNNDYIFYDTGVREYKANGDKTFKCRAYSKSKIIDGEFIPTLHLENNNNEKWIPWPSKGERNHIQLDGVVLEIMNGEPWGVNRPASMIYKISKSM